jgi:hypothetical protein
MEEREHKTERTIKDASVDTQIIFDRLVKVAVGETVPYSELSALVGRDVQHAARGNMESARNMAMREHRMVFDAVWGEGLKRLDDQGIVGTGKRALDRIRRKARRSAKTLSCVADFAALPNEAKIKHNATVSILGVLAHMTRPKSVTRIEGLVEQKSEKIALQKVLEAFRQG